MLAQLTGKTHVKNLEPEDLRAITLDAATITGVKLAGRELYFGKIFWKTTFNLKPHRLILFVHYFSSI